MTPPIDLVLWLVSCFGLGCITGIGVHFFKTAKTGKKLRLS
jgi:hypothetical protein